MSHLTDEWLSAAAAQAVGGLTEAALSRAVADGRVRVSRERGRADRYSRADVLREAGILK